MSPYLQTFKNRLKEPSSWAGLGMLVAMGPQAWATKDPNAIGGVLAGLIAMFLPEQKKADTPPQQ